MNADPAAWAARKVGRLTEAPRGIARFLDADPFVLDILRRRAIALRIHRSTTSIL